ncbi:glycosyltransferase family 4 protein [Elizabethkingia meningoseptica]|uniref:glycosyltransferase family 4 protein n=1 Tax=Elizabethkingia meningoseptica TaxID=238 RepID=UPI002012269D|nr:glycosyltransferase family 4 protein [Elizabethkingia meningoseptica]MCL1675665.1 glycosyltransferase family 4 protein [Elizabethkingia meningoseptica]MCL1686919.1 glycosyltransferase family 4 protein [Elizabethkingia meningoseptica]
MENNVKFFIITTVSDSLPFFKGQLNVLKKYFSMSLISNPGVHLEEMSKEYNVSAFPIKMEREISPWKDLKSLFSLYKLFQKEKPMVVHGNTPKASLLSMIAARLAGVPVRIYYVHGLRYESVVGKKKKLLMLMEKVSCYFATNIIAVSKGTQEQLKSDNITSKEIELIWNGSINGIDTAYFDPDKVNKAEIERITEKDFVFGFVGRIVKDKGIEELVCAFLELLKDNKNIKLLILGDFEENVNLSPEIVDKIHNHPNIVYVGRQQDVRPFFKIMDVFVLPSYREGFGMVLIEAGAMKIPSIVTNISGCNEVIINNKTGFLIENKNKKDLYSKMKYIIDNQDMINEIGENARISVEERYIQNKLWDITKETYLKILNKYV